MHAKWPARTATVLCVTFLFSLPCLADEIEFQNAKGPQIGVVIKEDTGSVTIRFQRQAIKSITHRESVNSSDPGDKVVWQASKDYLILKIPRDSIRVVPQQAEAPAPVGNQGAAPSLGLGDNTGAGRTVPPEPAVATVAVPSSTATRNMRTQQAEMGSAQGVIMWQKMPLPNARVKIVLQRYTGFSMAALKRWHASNGALQREEPIALETRTDAKGHYFFPKAPPGFYRLYWMPEPGAGWIRRLRETPDLEIISGNPTIENVPEKMR